jgi:GTP:adenosylcobinamide-phosphate guanylyltransferase
MGEWTAIVLAGDRPGENDFAAAHGVSAKALIPVGGEPMLSRVARTLLASPSIGRIVVLAQRPDALFTGGAGWLAAESRVATAVAGDGISASVAEIAGSPAAPWPVLVTTADHALLQPEMVEAFIAKSEGADSAFAMVEREVVERAYPQTKRTWIALSDGDYSGANLFALRTPASLSGVRFWSRAERHRKKAWRLLWFFGPAMFVRAVTRRLSLEQASARAGRKLRIGLRAVKLPYAEASIDVDKPADLELAERILARRPTPPLS